MTSSAAPSDGQPARRRPRPLTAAALGLPAEARVAGRQDGLTAHVRATVDAGLRVLLAEQATAGLAEEPESVHRMRVTARRMRVVLRLDRGGLGGAADELRAELSWLAGLLGAVRDLDVLCERLAEDATGLAEPDLPGFAEVLTALLAARANAAGLLVKALARQRYRTLLQRLAAEATTVDPCESGPADPDSLLARPVRALHLQLAAAAQSPSDATWHELRIRVKRVRYTAEVAVRLAGPKRAAALRELASTAKAAQEWLGAFQDTVVAEHHLRQLVTAHPTGLSTDAVLVAGRLVERQVRKRNELRERLPAACGDLYRVTRKRS